MVLTKLEIELKTYGPDKGKYTGAARFAGETGIVSIKLNQHHLDEIFRTCADSIIEVAQAAARHMTRAIIDQRDAGAIAQQEKDYD